jgi:very-short-patch-repair endonuclease
MPLTQSDPKKILFAKELRKVATDAEFRIWYFLRDRRLGGFKFRRQFVVGPYIVDFCCFDKKLIVELDGSQHMDSETDKGRTTYLAEKGFKVMRFWNHDVLKETATVCERILHRLRGSNS